MPGVDRLVVFKRVVADFLGFVSVEVGTDILDDTVEPILSVPVFGGTVDNFRGNWSVDVFFPQPVIRDFAVDCRE